MTREQLHIEQALIDHISQEEQAMTMQAHDIQSIKYTLYGNSETGDIGMAKKVNEMYEMVVVAKGGKMLLGFIVLCGAAVSAVVIIRKIL